MTDVVPDGRSYALLSLGDQARGVAAGWAVQLADSPLWQRHADRLDEPLLADFRAELAAVVVGWRLLLCGPSAEVQVLRAEAVRAGAVPAEIHAVVTSAGPKRVYCAHCRTIGPGPVCSGCGLHLTVTGHHSRRLAAFLGFKREP
ncbi:MAG: dimethylamine monooxygenase subunit DmmA family protein [Streptosporangiaceae bacterium]